MDSNSDIKLGDRVRYLNSEGGGVVTAFQGKDKVIVLEDDGFETIILKRQCIIVDESESKMFRTPVAVPEQPKANVNESQESHEAKKSSESSAKAKIQYPETREGEIINLFLAFLPAEGKAFTDSCFESYLINDSNYKMLFNFATCQNQTWESRFSGEIDPNSKLYLETYEREGLAELEKASVQCIAFKETGFYKRQETFSVDIKVETIKFFKIHCFKENDFFDEDALVYSLIKDGKAVREVQISSEELTKSLYEKEVREENHPAHDEKPARKKREELIEVDLHINALLDDTSGMTHGDMLNYQIDVFRKAMDEHIVESGRKIVFIHGKGDGVLRSAILKDLKSRYKGCSWQDASFREYGFGATLVTIHKTRK